MSLANLYPKYFKSVAHLKEVDVYAVHNLFGINDPSGAIQHASKKLLLSGVRTGGKSKYQDIREARDTLNRWLELNEEAKPFEAPVPAEPEINPINKVQLLSKPDVWRKPEAKPVPAARK